MILGRLWRVWRRRRTDDLVLREEMATHLLALEEEYRAQGLSAEESRTAARRRFGNVTRVGEDVRALFTFGVIERVAQDVRYAVRSLRGSPGFAAFTLVILGIGVGATTTIFSLVNGLLLQSLPFREPHRLVMLEEQWLPRFPRFEASPLDFLAWRDQSTAFSDMAAFQDVAFNLTDDDRPERVEGARVSANLPEVLGVDPLLGRSFTPDEDRYGAPPVVLLGHGLWVRRFAKDPSIVGRSIRLNGLAYTVVGVMPAPFTFPQRVEIWTPMQFTPTELESRGNHSIWAVARLAQGHAWEQAQAELNLIMPRVQPVWSARVVPLTDHYVGEIRRALFVLLGAAGCLLLIACVNVASLLVTRASVREKEMSLRVALGASRGRIMQQVLTETMLLAVLGGGVGILLAHVGIRMVRALPLTDLSLLSQVRLDYPVLVFTCAITILNGVLLGLASARHLSRPDVHDRLRAGSRISGSRGRTRLRNALVVSEVALALVLLTGAGLLLKSLSKLLDVPSGVRAERVLTATINLPPIHYPEPYQQARFVGELIARLSHVPNVRAAAVSTGLPFASVEDSGIRFDGRPKGDPIAGTAANHYRVTPDYFRALQIPLVRGRALTERDTGTTTPVVVINETMARRFFPTDDPIGKRLDISGPTYLREIVGVVGDVKQEGLRRPTPPQVYEAFAQKPSAAFRVVVSGTTDPSALVEVLRREVRAIDTQQPLSDVIALEDIVAGTMVRDRSSTWLLGLLALVALVLASIGLYGLVAYTVTQRQHEIGIRLALGADGWGIVRLVVGQSVRLIFSGLAIGLVVSLGLSRVLDGLLYDVPARDPATLVSIAILLWGVASVAALIPALHALRVHPRAALSAE